MSRSNKVHSQVFRSIDVEIVENIKKILVGLTATEWYFIKNSIDMYFNKKATEIKIDDLDMLDVLLKRNC